MDITLVDTLTVDVLERLRAILVDAVENGASVGFVLPLAAGEADEYWKTVAAGVSAGTRVLLVAREAGCADISGTVQLALAEKANGRHRAEVQRLLVPVAGRRKGTGRHLMKAAEGEALRRGRTLLVWDTIEDSTGDHLYRSMGYTRAGVIPRYARSSDGQRLEPTVIYYADLEGAVS